jgi:hypothetical protein
MLYVSRKSQKLHSIVKPPCLSHLLLRDGSSVLAKIEKRMETFVSLAPRVEGSCRVMGNEDRREGGNNLK